jgi:predicted deacylase
MAKNQTIAFRTSSEDKERWEAAAKEKQMSLTEYLHYIIQRADRLEKENHLLETAVQSFQAAFDAYVELENESKLSAELRKSTQQIIFQTMQGMFKFMKKEGFVEKKRSATKKVKKSVAKNGK